MIKLRKAFTAIVATVLLFLSVFVGNSAALAGDYSAESWNKLPTLSDDKPAANEGGYYSHRDNLKNDKAFSKDATPQLTKTLEGKSDLPRPDRASMPSQRQSYEKQSYQKQSKSYIDLDEKDNVNIRNAKRNLEKTADDAQGGLDDVVDNVREKLNLDQPLYPGTKEFINDVKDSVGDSVDAVQDTFTGGADNVTGGQRSYKNR
ncbi:hypothetical protein [Leptolyngbya ohadii]|uniref:hypothetical protein n=1 Tax=Leptolyngbya ohadii TaxID=1962290 RepID=UPI000B59DEEA|nr:hypothetical protein [Leptolyngbya ohadii]